MSAWVGGISGAELIILLGILIACGVYFQKKNTLFPKPITIEHVAVSRWAFVSSKMLLWFRVLYFLLSLSISVAQFGVRPSQILLIFFTNWCYYLETVYFGLVAYISFVYLRTQPATNPHLSRKRSPTENEPQQDNINPSTQKLVPQPLLRAVQITCVIISTCCLFVAVITWCILLPNALHNHSAQYFLDVFSYFQHAINVPAILFEYLGNSISIHPTHVIFVLGWVTIYALHALIIQACHTRSPYFITDIKTPAVILWFIGMMLVVVVFFVFVMKLDSWVRKRSPVRVSHMTQMVVASMNPDLEKP
eukprot:c5287_g1_i1.p1 GENE.c5287_g1_i1~~c5287_g1_i1.p1  ORF type:complete len:321 (+),score=53.73 c5287_g1_i1:44-964(+)